MKAQRYCDLPVAILCGGQATRLGELTRATPKSLVDVNGQPFLFHQFRLLSRFNRIVLCACHLSDQLKPFGIVSEDGPVPLGTGGAINRALPLLGDEFFVLYGDSYLPIDYEPIFEAHRAAGKFVTQTQFSNVDFGMSIFSREAFALFSGSFDIHEVFDAMRAMDQLAIYQSPSRFYEIGSPAGLEEVRKLLR